MQALLDAARAGDTQSIVALLEHGESIDAKDGNGKTALHWAILKEQREMVELLLKRGINVEAKDNHDEIPLHYAVECKDLQIAKILASISPVNSQDKDGYTPLHRAIFVGDVTMMTLLLSHKADSNIGDSQKRTSLHLAAMQDKAIAIGILLAHGAIIDMKDSSGRIALHLAARMEAIAAVECLLNCGSAINAQDNEGATALHYAIKENKPATLVILLKNFANTAILDNEGNSAVNLIAKTSSNIVLLDELIKHGGCINEHDCDGMTPLHWLIARGGTNWARLLLRNRATVNARTHEGKTPFHFIGAKIKANRISVNSHCEAIKLLLNYGTAIDVQDGSGKTLLHHLLLQGRSQETQPIVKTLLTYKASVNIKDSEGNTPLHYAVLAGNHSATRLLLQHGAHIYISQNDQYNLDNYWPKSITSDNLKIYTTMMLAGMRSVEDKFSTIGDKTLRENRQVMRRSLETTVLDWLKSITPVHVNNEAHRAVLHKDKAFVNNMASNMLRALPYLIDATAPLKNNTGVSCLDDSQRDKFCIETLKFEYDLGVFSELVYFDARLYRDRYIAFYKQIFQRSWKDPCLPPNNLSSPVAVALPLKRQRI